MSTKFLNIIMAILFCVIFWFLAMPWGTPVIDKIEPHILGLPCMQACILYGSILMAFLLIVWFLVECKIEDREAKSFDAIGKGDEN